MRQTNYTLQPKESPLRPPENPQAAASSTPNYPMPITKTHPPFSSLQNFTKISNPSRPSLLPPPRQYFVDNKKGELHELQQILRQVRNEKVAKKRRETLSRVIAYMTIGIDVSSLFSEMVMACSTDDFVEKKMAYLYLTTYAESHPDLTLLAVNTLQKDASHEDPHIRGLALRSLCSLKLTTMTEYLEKALLKGLNDRSVYVRRFAVMGCLKFYYLNPSAFSETAMLQKLHDLFEDKDAQVIRNSLIVLNEIYAKEGGLTLTKQRLTNLLLRIKQFDEWGQCIVLDWISGYQTSNENEIFAIMNILDYFLKHPSSAVTLSCTKCFFNLSQDIDSFFLQVVERLKAPFISLMRKSCAEIAYAILLHVSLLIHKGGKPAALLFANDYHEFYCKYNDVSYIKTEKIKILTNIVTSTNVSAIYSELSEYIADVSPIISKLSIEALGKIAIALPTAASSIMKILLSFLTVEIEHVVPTILNTLKYFLMKYKEFYEEILPSALQCFHFVTDPVGLSSLVWMIGEFGETVEDSPYLLENCICEEDQDETLRLALLTASLKLFFKRPAEMQPILGNLFKKVIEGGIYPDVHDRALLYYRLLLTDVEKTKTIIFAASKEEIHTFQEVRCVTIARLFGEFNSLAVFLGKPSSQFVVIPPIPFCGQMDKIHASFSEIKKEAWMEKEEIPSSPLCPTTLSLLEGFNGDVHTPPLPASEHFPPSSAPSIFSFVHSQKPSLPSNTPSLLLSDNEPLLSPSSPFFFRLKIPEEIDASSFQDKWESIENHIEIYVKIAMIREDPFKSELTLSLFEDYFLDFHIQTMASGMMDSEEGPLLKLFVYAQDEALVYYLAEIQVYLHKLSMQLTLKTASKEKLNAFKEFFLQALKPLLEM